MTIIDKEQAALLEKGRLLFAGPCTFVTSVAELKQLPEDDRTEFAFAGRSNAGKSSLVNALTSRKTLAKTSNTPGRTQLINYFALGEDVAYLVDLPGYGYAKAPKDQVEKWTRLVMNYLRGRVSLKRVFILIDSRHGIKDSDVDTMKLLDKAAVPYQIVLTKTDKIKPAERPLMMEKTHGDLQRRPAAFPVILSTSSVSGDGVADLRAAIAGLI